MHLILASYILLEINHNFWVIVIVSHISYNYNSYNYNCISYNYNSDVSQNFHIFLKSAHPPASLAWWVMHLPLFTTVPGSTPLGCPPKFLLPAVDVFSWELLAGTLIAERRPCRGQHTGGWCNGAIIFVMLFSNFFFLMLLLLNV
jgi:hypothetical protein